MDDYLELTLDVFDERGQRAAVRGTLTAGQMIEEIVREFEGLQPGEAGAYALSLAGAAGALDPRRGLIEQGVQTGDRLVFGWAQKAPTAVRRPFAQPGRAALRELASGKVFVLAWQPARIGRPDSDAQHNELLAVNLDGLPNAGRVSRSHAQVTERDGVYFVEALSGQNPTRLNGSPLAQGQPARLAHGDRIELGLSGISLVFLLA
ncbi:MAG: FHA domain-containing protein [Chloroflexota bacterium]